MLPHDSVHAFGVGCPAELCTPTFMENLREIPTNGPCFA
jgi:hypothetical protein